MTDYMDTYQGFWEPIVTDDQGALNLDQVARELHDYRQLMESAAKVYEHIAGLTKPNTDPNVIIEHHDETVSELETALDQTIALLGDLADPDPCWFDHHGGCQAHGYLSLEPGEVCPVKRAQDLVAGHHAEMALVIDPANPVTWGPDRTPPHQYIEPSSHKAEHG